MLKLLIALAFIVDPNPITSLDEVEHMQKEVIEWAVKLQLIDSWQYRDYEYQADLVYFNNIKEFYKLGLKYPRIESLEMFTISPQDVNDYLETNRMFKQSLVNNRMLHYDKDLFDIVILETDDICEAYQLLRNAKQGYSIIYRRECLNNLRKIIGDADFNIGKMPPQIPTWRLKGIKSYPLTTPQLYGN